MGSPDAPDAPETGEPIISSSQNSTCPTHKTHAVTNPDKVATSRTQTRARAECTHPHNQFQSGSVTNSTTAHYTKASLTSGQQATQSTEVTMTALHPNWSTGDHGNTDTLDNYQQTKWSTGDPTAVSSAPNTISHARDALPPHSVQAGDGTKIRQPITHNREAQSATAHAVSAGQQATPEIILIAQSSQQLSPTATQAGTNDPPTVTPADRHQLTSERTIDTRNSLPLFLQRIGYPEAPRDNNYTKPQYLPDDDFDGLIVHNTYTPDGEPATTTANRTWPFPAPSLPPDLADMYEQAIEARSKDDPGIRPIINTALRLDEWEACRTGHDDDDWILDAIRHGFPIQFTGPPCYDPPLLYNHASALTHDKTIKDYIRKETAHGALLGPFDSPPFTPWMVFSPLMTREKPDSQERRVIVDLSYPGGGVNKHIHPHIFNGRPAVHNLPTIETAVTAINKLCPGDITMAVIDLSRAYRQFPVPPTDWPLLGIQYNGDYFCDARLPFGARLSSFAMQSVAQFLLRALEAKGTTAFMYLDDLIIIEGAYEITKRHYDQALTLLGTLGLEVAPHKLQPPSCAVTWLGVHIDMRLNRLSIPDSKIEEIHKCLAAAARQPTITVRHMQSVLGYVNHLAKVVRAARIFISRLLAALRAAKGEIIMVTPAVKADLA